MKILLKVTAVILLLVITLLSINAAEGGITITIEGKGQPFVNKEGGTVSGGCDPVNSNDCKITIQVPIQ